MQALAEYEAYWPSTDAGGFLRARYAEYLEGWLFGDIIAATSSLAWIIKVAFDNEVIIY